MRPNILRQRLASKTCATGGWCGIGSPYSAEILGHSGFDAVVVDLQHGMIFLEQAIGMLQAISATPAMPMARVSQNQFFEINKLLDAGAWGLICPLIDDEAAAETFVSACRYPPAGTRSFGPARGPLYGGADYFQKANETIFTWGMIETPQGLANLERIAAVTGLDGLFVGPSDMSLALGLPPTPRWQEAPLADALRRVVTVAHRNNKAAGIFCSGFEFADDMRKLGYDFVIFGNDAAALRTTFQGWNRQFRENAARDGIGAGQPDAAGHQAAGDTAAGDTVPTFSY